MTQRIKLIKELADKYSHSDTLIDFAGVVDFIIEERKRIVAPALALGQLKTQPLPSYEKVCQAVEEMIKLSGVEQ